MSKCGSLAFHLLRRQASTETPHARRLLSTCAQLIAALPFKRADEPLMALTAISGIIARRGDAAKDMLRLAVFGEPTAPTPAHTPSAAEDAGASITSPTAVVFAAAAASGSAEAHLSAPAAVLDVPELSGPAMHLAPDGLDIHQDSPHQQPPPPQVRVDTGTPIL